MRARDSERGGLLVLDEAQKITASSDVVTRLWDEDTAAGIPLRAVLLGSSPLLLQRGLADSLAGRFELIRVPHWSFPEMRDAPRPTAQKIAEGPADSGGTALSVHFHPSREDGNAGHGH